MVLKIAELHPKYIIKNNSIPINHRNNSIFKNLKKEINKLEDKTNQSEHPLLYALSPIPTVRRIESLPDKIKDKNYAGAGLQLGMAAANFAGDWTQIALAGREIKEIAANGFKNLPKREYHRVMPFFSGTFLQKWVGKFTWLEKFDKTLFNSKFGEKIINIFKINIKDTGKIAGITEEAKEIFTIKFGGNSLQKLVGRSLLRISKLGLITSSLIELPAIIKSVTQTKGDIIDKAKALGKQLIKSAGYIGLVNAGIAVAGAFLFPYGVAAELVGMAIGSTIGIKASNALNKKINNIFKTKESVKQTLPVNPFI